MLNWTDLSSLCTPPTESERTGASNMHRQILGDIKPGRWRRDLQNARDIHTENVTYFSENLGIHFFFFSTVEMFTSTRATLSHARTRTTTLSSYSPIPYWQILRGHVAVTIKRSFQYKLCYQGRLTVNSIGWPVIRKWRALRTRWLIALLPARHLPKLLLPYLLLS